MKNRFSYLLLLSNIITLLALVYLSVHYSAPSELIKKFISLQPVKAKKNYKPHKTYTSMRSKFSIYKPKNAKFIMLGDSICNAVEWNELFSRDDIVNRCIPGDRTEGFLRRLEDIFPLNPKLCIIMGGINDIGEDVPTLRILMNIKQITHLLIKHDITPVILSTLYVSSKKSNYKDINMKVKELNISLQEYAHNENIDYVDINSVLAPHGLLNEKYTFDGVDISGNGLIKWRDKLLPVLLKYQ